MTIKPTEAQIEAGDVTEDMLNAGQERLCELRCRTFFDDELQAEIFAAMSKAMRSSTPQEPEMLGAVAKAWAEPLWNEAVETCAARLYLEADQLEDARLGAILRRVADDIIATRLQAKTPETAWQPIETAPEYEEVLAFGHWKPSFQAPEPRMAVWERDGRDPNDFYCAAINGVVTHWQPLPEPPNPPYSGIVVVDEADFTRGEE